MSFLIRKTRISTDFAIHWKLKLATASPTLSILFTTQSGGINADNDCIQTTCLLRTQHLMESFHEPSGIHNL